MNDPDSPAESPILRALKTAIDAEEKSLAT